MSRPYDATLKHLLDEFAVDWISWLAPKLGLPPSTSADPLNVDLSTVQLEADKVFRLKSPAKGLLHIEPQTSWDKKLEERMMLYNGLIHQRYKQHVYSVVLLLRRKANASTLTGTLSRRYPSNQEYLSFEYSVIRIWELPSEPLLNGPLGALPLALLTDEANGRQEEFVGRMDHRLRTELNENNLRKLILTSSYILSGLRYNDAVIEKAFKGVTDMKESTTYQAILREGRKEGIVVGEKKGRAEGRAEGRQEGMLNGSKRLC